MKNGIEMGVTHYTPLVAPLTEGTAKNMMLLLNMMIPGGAMEGITGKLLVQQERMLPLSRIGIRNTFEAHGYSAWDPSSPAFIVR